MRRTRWLLAMTAALTVACGGGGGGGGTVHKADYELGFTTDLSAGQAVLGKGVSNGFNAYITAVNKKGGVNGHHLKVTYLDDQMQNDRGIANFTQLTTQGKPLAVAGEVLSNVCNAMTPLALERKVPLVCVTASADAIKQPSTFIVQPSTPEQALPTFNLAKSLAKVPSPKIGVVNLALATSSQFGDAMVKLAPANGATAVREQIDAANPDPTAQLTRLVGSKPDVIILNAVDLQATKLVQAMKAANLDVPIVNTGGGVSLTAILGFRNPKFYVLTAFLYVNPALPSGTNRTVVEYANDVKSIGGDPNGNFTAAGYIEAVLVVAAIKKCGDSCTGKKVRDNLESLHIPSNGLAGSSNIGFSAKNHEGITALSAWSWDDATQAMKAQQSNLPLGTA